MARTSYVFTSESVSEGHPDKVADRISDTVVDAFLGADPEARVACETMVTTQRIILAGEVRGPEGVVEGLEDKVRAAIKDIGYQQEGFHWKTANYACYLHAQSADIAQGGGRGRSGHHVRLRLQRNPGIDAGDAAIFAQHPETAGGGSPFRRTPRARTRRQESGDAQI